MSFNNFKNIKINILFLIYNRNIIERKYMKHLKNYESFGDNRSIPIHRCKLVPYGNEEKRCVKCGYITWSNNNKTDSEIIQDMIDAGYDVPDCDNARLQPYPNVLRNK